MYLWRNSVFRNDRRGQHQRFHGMQISRNGIRAIAELISDEGEVSKRKLSFTIIPLLWEHNELPSWIFTKWGEIAFACHGAVTYEFFPLFPHSIYRFLNERTLRLIGRFDRASVTWSHRTYILIGELIWRSVIIRGSWCL